MPANTKYLTVHMGHRIAKITAGIVGGFLISVGTLLSIAAWSNNPKNVFLTFFYLMFIQWCALMLIAFLFKSGLKCWAWYGSVIIILTAIYILGKTFSS